MKKQFLAVLLTLAMLLSLLPASAIAAEGGEDGEVPVVYTETGEDPEADPTDVPEENPTGVPDEPDEASAEGEGDSTVTGPEQEELVEEPTAEDQLAELIADLPDPTKIDPLDEEQKEAIYNQISAIYAFAEANGLGDRDNGLLDEAANATVNAVIAAAWPAELLANEGQTISTDTEWNTATPLSGNLTIESGVTLTIGAQVTINGNVTISGGGTIKRAEGYTGDIDQYTADAPKTAHLFYVPAGSSLTLTNITIDGNAGWTLNETAPDVAWSNNTYSGSQSTSSHVIGAMILNEGTLNVNTGAVLQNNFNYYQSDSSGTSLGGAVFNNGQMTVGDGAKIQYNSSRYGGAINNGAGSSLVIEGGSIQYNNGSAGAGGVMAFSGAALTMTGGEINGNNSKGWGPGAGLFIGSSDTVSLTGGKITGNTSVSYGGGIYIRAAAAPLSIGAIEISDNTASQGGGVYILGSSVTFNGTNIVSNKASSYGGGVYCNSPKLEITGETKIQENKSIGPSNANGGGVHFDNASGTCTIDGNASISQNSAAQGGGLYIKGTCIINGNASVSQNTASIAGGGIAITSGTLTAGGNAAISSNKAAVNEDGTYVTTGSPDGGGGIYAVNVSVTVKESAAISENDARLGGAIRTRSATITFQDTASASKNKASNGGAIYAQEGSLTIQDTAVIGGEAESGNSALVGGGIYVAGSCKFSMNGGKISENSTTATSGGNGGGIYFSSTSTAEITNAEILNNTAANYGGGVYLFSGQIDIKNSTISENTGLVGGGICAWSGDSSSSTLNITDSSVTKNSATATDSYLGGGGISTSNTATVTITGGEISENTTTASGGGIQTRFSTTINGTKIVNNTANSSGGGIDVYAGDLVLSGNPIITGNTVSENANNVYLRTKDSKQLTITLADALTPGAAIGVTTQTAVASGSPVQITTVKTGADTTYYQKAVQYFIPDAANVIAQANETSKYVELAYTTDTYYKVTLDLTNITPTGGTVTQVKSGDTYSTAISANTGYSLPESITSPTSGVTYQKNDQTNVANISMTVTDNTTIKVEGKANTYTVVFNANGGRGNTMQSQTMTYDVAQELTANTYSKANYNFAGWSKTPNGTCEYPDKASVKYLTTTNGATVTLYAVWTAKEVIPTFDGAVQSSKYDGSAKSYDLTSEIEGFKITYKQGEEPVNEPKNVGTYDVVISRDEDDTYAAFTQTIAGGLVITAADYPVSITADKTSMTGSDTVKLTVSATIDGVTVTNVTCSDSSITVTKNDDGTYSATLPNTTKTYTFTAEVDGVSANYGSGPATCTVSVTRYTSGGGGGSSSGGSTTYTVTVDSGKNGTVTVSPKNASKGATVTITVKPNSGYEVDDLTVTDKNGDTVRVKEQGNGKYTFTMPASKVTVEASFTKIEEQPSVTFADVPTSAYYADAVAWAVENGITYGTSATTFSPDLACTRAQAVTFLWRAAGSPAPKSSVNPFADVSASAYYYDAVLWAVEQGITVGTSATTFSPDTTCTRGQIVTFLYRAEGTATTGSNPFTDVSNSAYYVDAVKWAVAESVTAGTSATTFSPDASCTRAQIVTFLYRAYAD